MSSKPLYAQRSCSWQQTKKGPVCEQRWENVKEYDGQPFSDALEGVSINVLERAYQLFSEKIEGARRGELTFGKGERFDVDFMRSTTDVLEIKWSNNPPKVRGRQQVWLRIYFSEPSPVPGLLLSLNMHCKSADGLDEQTEEALIAQERFNEWQAKNGVAK